jgi:hypothetical protein
MIAANKVDLSAINFLNSNQLFTASYKITFW